uniref:Uncharacterized protein n=1 Tax=Manihot esculenta TaxID=3983 RepID=A0A2C9VI13_MANES
MAELHQITSRGFSSLLLISNDTSRCMIYLTLVYNYFCFSVAENNTPHVL